MSQLAIVRSRALIGLQAPEVTVEVHVGQGLPAFHIVGLPEAAVRESRDRVRAALVHGGFSFPNRRLTVNLAPADLPKDSGRFDLPIAIGILAASGQVPVDTLDTLEFVGELSLTGELRPIRGALPMTIAVRDAQPARRLVLPGACASEARLVPELRALAAASLAEVCAHLRGSSPLERLSALRPQPAARSGPDLADVKGQAQARRALEIAAAGGHSMLMIGPPGAGKSLMAARLPSILPGTDESEALEAAAIQALIAGFDPQHWGRRPFRHPHHSASAAALVGGGSHPRPGEISLAHHGVLFLDELPEFNRAALEALREPLETGRIALSRVARQIELPARFQLLAAMNPCPCGHLGSPRCRCSAEQVLRYQRRVSGPLIDRIDIVITVRPVDEHTLTSPGQAEASATVAARVLTAHTRQRQRQGLSNARLEAAALEHHCPLHEDALQQLARAARQLQWSSRALHRVIRVARTIADLAGVDIIGPTHAGEAIALRRTSLDSQDPPS